MRLTIAFVFMFIGTAASAHHGPPELLGLHEPWLIGAGIGAIILAGLVGKRKGDKEAEEEASDDEPEGEIA